MLALFLGENMKYTNAFTNDFVLTDDILSIGQQAKERKRLNPKTIDATIGALLDDSGKLLAFQTVEDTLNSLDSRKVRAYPPVDGGKPFKSALKHWVFQDTLNHLEQHFKMEVLATPGASGALSNILSNYVTKGDLVVLPDIFWSNYAAIIHATEAFYVTFPMFLNQGFNLDGFKMITTQVAEKTNKVVVLLNDPCQNPTGYSLSETELKGVIQHLDALAKKTPVVLIYDIAYLDYADIDYKDTRKRFLNFLDVKSDLLITVAFSASKTFGIYGYRGGGIVALSKSQSVIDEFSRVSLYKARSTWSCPPTEPIFLLNTLVEDTVLNQTFRTELYEVRNLLQKRAKAFIEEAKQIGLKHYPYVSGFFVTIPVESPKKVFERLKEQDIFVVPLSNAIRVALAAITELEIIGLPTKIKREIEKA